MNEYTGQMARHCAFSVGDGASRVRKIRLFYCELGVGSDNSSTPKIDRHVDAGARFSDYAQVGEDRDLQKKLGVGDYSQSSPHPPTSKGP